MLFYDILIDAYSLSTGSEPEWATVPQRFLETITEEDHPDSSVATKGSVMLSSVLTTISNLLFKDRAIILVKYPSKWLLHLAKIL